jgi:hypothetical protein
VTTTAAGQEITLYAAVLPTTTGALTLTAKTSANKSYIATLSSKTIVAGKAYRYTVSELVAQTTGTENGYAWVDLGLSVKWATMNVGATSVTGYGNYYAWGETEPQSSNSYYFDSYKWVNGTSSYMTKYCVSTSYGTVDNNTTLDSDDDAASVNWGGKWRMPTRIEQKELITNCYWVWTSSYNDSGKAGYIIYKAKSSSDKGQVVTSGNTPSSSYSLSDSHIFLPAAGFRYEGSLYTGGAGYYWMSSLGEYLGSYACIFYFSSGSRGDSFYSRCRGHSVRAVCE